MLIAIPTFQRSDALKHVLETTRDRLNSAYHHVSILVVDNNPTPQEQAAVEAFSETTHLPVHYLHEPAAGVSNARNAAIAFAETRFLAFLDDDMEITADWLDELVKTSCESGFGVIFRTDCREVSRCGGPAQPVPVSLLFPHHERPTVCGIEKAFRNRRAV